MNCNPCSNDVLQQAISRLLTCAPHHCPREVDCFVVARALSRRVTKELYGQPMVVSRPAPTWEAPNV